MRVAVTIKDVAKLANVAPSTVSRVIANSPRISTETKKKVKDAMKELGYHPNFIARSLVSQSTQVIGMIMPSSDAVFENPFFQTVIKGIIEGARVKNYAIQMLAGRTEEENLESVKQMVQGKRVDGAILLYSKVEDKIIDYLKESRFPFVVIGKPYKDVEEITHVDNDNVRAANHVTESLISLGHKKIAFIGGSLDLVVTIDRLNGYKDALENAGLELLDEYVKHDDFIREGGREAVRDLMSLDNQPTALVVADDLMALGVLNMLDELGIMVPDDVSVVSFNNVLLAELARPQLTSVDINIFDLGYQAARSLIQTIKDPNEPVKRIIIKHHIVKRSTCAKLPE